MSRWALPVLTAGVLTFTTQAGARTGAEGVFVPHGPAPALFHPHHKPFAKMTLHELAGHQKAAVARYRYVTRFYLQWRKDRFIRQKGLSPPRFTLAALSMVRCKALGILAPPNYCWYASAWRWTEKELEQTQAKLRLIEIPAFAIGVSSTEAWRIGRLMAAKAGWTDGNGQWSCLSQLWGGLEGSWYVYADNPHSEAYGIPQALPGSKMGVGWQNDAVVQIRWGLGYVSGRYGSPCGALNARLAQGWY